MKTSWRLILAALILGLAGNGCGGSDKSSTDSTSGAGGNEVVGGSDGTGGTDEVPAVKGPDGEWTCTQGLLLKKEPPMCQIQATTEDPADAALPTPDSSTEPDPADMGTEPTPDAAIECRDWNEQRCDLDGEGALCVLVPADPQPGYPCLWDCLDPDHRDRSWTIDISGDDVPFFCPNLAE